MSYEINETLRNECQQALITFEKMSKPETAELSTYQTVPAKTQKLYAKQHR